MNLFKKIFSPKNIKAQAKKRKSPETVVREEKRQVSQTIKEPVKPPGINSPVQIKVPEPVIFDLKEEKKWEIGQTLLNEYTVEKYLGEGGMGTVYLMVQREMDNQRFAVKTLLASALKDDQRRKLFLQELRTWMDLPEYLHLTTFCFFRTIEDRLAIFAEYVDGSSLKEWIRDRKILKIEQILDIAIQFAWGLQEAHNHNIIHQDVKPANVLMTKEGIVKITDFGLAGARNAGKIEFRQTGKIPSGLVSVHGMTEAYCSPEQANWQKLSHKTDIWSWGLSVLEMFTGSATWQNGSIAHYVLEDYTKQEPKTPYPQMPDSVVGVLRKCFKENPEERWDTLDDAAECLKKVYQQETGKPYFRKKPTPVSKITENVIYDRKTLKGAIWADPVIWLNKAFLAANMDVVEMAGMIPERRGSRKAQALVDLEVYEQTEAIYEKLKKNGRQELAEELANLFMNMAFLQDNIGDKPGAIQSYDKVIEIRERLVFKEGRKEMLNDLGSSYMNKGVTLWSYGEKHVAITMYDKSIEIWKELVYKEDRNELRNSLARAYMNKGLALWSIGEHRQAIKMYNESIQIRERLVFEKSQVELLNDLALTYENTGIAFKALGEYRQANILYDKAIEIRNQLIQKYGQRELLGDIAITYMIKGNVLRTLGEYHQAVAIHDKAIKIMEKLIYQEGRAELLSDLAGIYINKGVALFSLNENRQAVTMFDKTIQIWEQLVYMEGRTELLADLADVYMNKGVALSSLQDKPQAVLLYDKTIEILERLVYEKSQTELRNKLARVYYNKGTLSFALGKKDQAIVMLEKAVEIWNALVCQEGHTELMSLLTTANNNKTIFKRSK